MSQEPAIGKDICRVPEVRPHHLGWRCSSAATQTGTGHPTPEEKRQKPSIGVSTLFYEVVAPYGGSHLKARMPKILAVRYSETGR